MQKTIFIFSLFFQVSILAQNSLNIDSFRVKEIISSNKGIFLASDSGYIHLQQSNILKSINISSYENLQNRSKHQLYNFQIVSYDLMPSEVIRLNQVTFQRDHDLSLFIIKQECGNLQLTSSAAAIIDLLVNNEYSTSNSLFFSMYD